MGISTTAVAALAAARLIDTTSTSTADAIERGSCLCIGWIGSRAVSVKLKGLVMRRWQPSRRGARIVATSMLSVSFMADVSFFEEELERIRIRFRKNPVVVNALPRGASTGSIVHLGESEYGPLSECERFLIIDKETWVLLDADNEPIGAEEIPLSGRIHFESRCPDKNHAR
jgi:hypothetical protein